MEEKILVKSERFDLKKLISVLLIIGAVASVIMFVAICVSYGSYYDSRYEDDLITYEEHSAEGDCGYRWDEGEKCYKCEFVEKYPNKAAYIFSNFFETLLLSLIPVAALGLIGGLIFLWLRSYELTVTDKRIFGKVAFGKRVDLPVDSVSATATIQLLKGVAVSTSSGKISFLAIKNASEIYEVINSLLIDRQKNEKIAAKTVITETKTDEADQLVKYKELLDKGVISQEEYEAKKKQLLGL